MSGQPLTTLGIKKGLHYDAESAEMDINLQRKNMSNFKTWSHENLADFAHQANEKMIQQNERIQELQRDLKDALAAYRNLNCQIQPDFGKSITSVNNAHRDVSLK